MNEDNENIIVGSEGQTESGAEEKESTEPSARDLIFSSREKELLEEVGSLQDDPGEKIEPEDEPEKKQVVKVKIDGIEEEKNITDIEATVREYQKYMSADKRLQQAALEQKRLEEERGAIEQARLQLNEQLIAQNSLHDSKNDVALNELIAARRDAMEIGDYEEFDRLDEQISNHRISQSKVDTDKILQEASSVATNRAVNQIQYESAFNQFKADNADLLGDETLFNMTMATFNNLCRESTSYQEAFAKTGTMMKNWISGIAPKSNNDDAMATRLERKQSIPAEPGRLNKKSTLPPAEKEETASDIVMNMRKARGLPI